MKRITLSQLIADINNLGGFYLPTEADLEEVKQYHWKEIQKNNTRKLKMLTSDQKTEAKHLGYYNTGIENVYVTALILKAVTEELIEPGFSPQEKIEDGVTETEWDDIPADIQKLIEKQGEQIQALKTQNGQLLAEVGSSPEEDSTSEVEALNEKVAALQAEVEEMGKNLAQAKELLDIERGDRFDLETANEKLVQENQDLKLAMIDAGLDDVLEDMGVEVKIPEGLLIPTFPPTRKVPDPIDTVEKLESYLIKYMGSSSNQISLFDLNQAVKGRSDNFLVLINQLKVKSKKFAVADGWVKRIGGSSRTIEAEVSPA